MSLETQRMAHRLRLQSSEYRNSAKMMIALADQLDLVLENIKGNSHWWPSPVLMMLGWKPKAGVGSLQVVCRLDLHDEPKLAYWDGWDKGWRVSTTLRHELRIFPDRYLDVLISPVDHAELTLVRMKSDMASEQVVEPPAPLNRSDAYIDGAKFTRNADEETKEAG